MHKQAGLKPNLPAFVAIVVFGLTLRELEAGGRWVQTVLFTFFSSGVAGKEPGTLKHTAQIFINSQQSARNAVAHSFGLTRNTAARYNNLNIKTLKSFGQVKGLTG